VGLGLAISKQLVELHAGTISAHCAGRDQVATFTVWLPSVNGSGQAEMVEASKPSEPVNPHALRGVAILFVEDDLVRGVSNGALRRQL
jgi:hypothetical protein